MSQRPKLRGILRWSVEIIELAAYYLDILFLVLRNAYSEPPTERNRWWLVHLIDWEIIM